MTAVEQCDVLIVDDDMSLCDIMAASLARRGLAVRSALSASSALAILERVRPKVAVLDYRLPGASGVDLAARIHGLFPDVPIILMSGGTCNLDEAMLDKIGVKIFVNKPVPMAALHRAVVQLIH